MFTPVFILDKIHLCAFWHRKRSFKNVFYVLRQLRSGFRHTSVHLPAFQSTRPAPPFLFIACVKIWKSSSLKSYNRLHRLFTNHNLSGKNFIMSCSVALLMGFDFKKHAISAEMMKMVCWHTALLGLNVFSRSFVDAKPYALVEALPTRNIMFVCI